MEHAENGYAAAIRDKRRKKRIRTICIAGGVAVLVIAAILFLFSSLGKQAEIVSVLTYRATAVAEGEIRSTVSGSGTLSALHLQTVTAAGDVKVESVNFAAGDAVKEGDIVMTLSSAALKDKLDDLRDQLADVQEDLATVDQTRSSLSIKAEQAGVVKVINAKAGDLCEDLATLCVISTDGKMKVVVDAPSGMKKYDEVTVSVAGDTIDGRVTDISVGRATVVIDTDGYDVGAAATVSNASGETLGTGALDVNEHVDVTASAGRIDSVKVELNQSVKAGKTLFRLSDGAPSDDYLSYKETEADLLEQIEDTQDALVVRADHDGILATLSVDAGDEVDAGGALCVLSGTDGYEITLAVDELDIASVKLGQDVAVTLDALEDQKFAGKVTNISFAGSGSYVTSYTVTITTDPIAGAYPGMTASAAITTETSGITTIVSVNAVQYDGDTAYLLLCGDDVAAGAAKDQAELDIASLERLTVTTGMSDGSYIAVTAEGLSAGDLIWVPQLATTSVYSSDDSTTAMFSQGGMRMQGGASFSSSGRGDSYSGGGYPGGEMPAGGMQGGGNFPG